MDRYNICQTKHTAHTLVGGQYLAGWPPRKTIRSSDSTRKASKYGALTNIYIISTVNILMTRHQLDISLVSSWCLGIRQVSTWYQVDNWLARQQLGIHVVSSWCLVINLVSAWYHVDDTACTWYQLGISLVSCWWQGMYLVSTWYQ